MKKLRLDELKVESFVTSTGRSVAGTVHAHHDHSGNGWCSTDAGMQSCNAAACGGSHDINCNPGGGTATMNGITCNVTCAKGETDCGTCYPAASCDLQYGCSGTSFDMQPC